MSLANGIADNDYPVYIRQIAKLSAWGDDSDDAHTRILNARNSVFPASADKYSLYLVQSEIDLRRVVVALNSFRSRINDKFDLVLFTEDELTASEIAIEHDVPGITECFWAIDLHVDVHANVPDKFTDLCRLALANKREAYRVSKSVAKDMVEKQKAAQCEAMVTDIACSCRNETLFGASGNS